MSSLTIDMVHANGELRTVQVIRGYKNTLDVIWPLCGTYRIDLSRNILLRAPEWRVADIEEAWRIYDRIAIKQRGTGLAKREKRASDNARDGKTVWRKAAK